MVDEFKNIRGSLMKAVMSTIKESSVSVKGMLDEDDDEDDIDDPSGNLIDAKMVRELLGGVFAKAGKSKDEIVGIVAREIGMSVAAAIKEPLKMLAENQRLQITFEFVDKNQPEKDNFPKQKPKTTAAQKKVSKKSPKKKSKKKK